MDLLEVKSRIAEALVEYIFRRARYQIRPFRTDAFPLRFGREDFSPDFRVSSEGHSVPASSAHGSTSRCMPAK